MGTGASNGTPPAGQNTGMPTKADGASGGADAVGAGPRFGARPRSGLTRRLPGPVRVARSLRVASCRSHFPEGLPVRRPATISDHSGSESHGPARAGGRGAEATVTVTVRQAAAGNHDIRLESAAGRRAD